MAPQNFTPGDWQLLEQYFGGDATAEDIRSLTNWLGCDPDRDPRIGALRAAIADSRLSHGASAPDSQLALEKIFREIPTREMPEQADGLRTRRPIRQKSEKPALRGGMLGLGTYTARGWAGVVTALVAMLIVLVHRIPSTEMGVTRTYATTVWQQAVIHLDDGTRVTLSPHTILKLQHFGSASRVVVLEAGEAYFEVVKTAGSPFVVRSGATRTQVLGTSFLVRHNVGDSHVRVSVADGKVRVTTSARRDANITLSARQVGDVTDSTTQVSNPDELTPGTEWAPGRIMFRHVPAAMILETVSRWYGYHFRYADHDFGKQSVTMIVSTRSSAQALAAIERVLAVNLTVVGDTVTLVSQSPQSNRNVPRIRTYDVWTPTREVGR